MPLGVLRLEFTPGDYEAGVADFLAARVGSSATVERDVRLPGSSGGTRQIDVLVRFPNPGLGETLMVVDCKLWSYKVDIKDVESFIGLVNDVGAPLGLLVTTLGFTERAKIRAANERGIHVEVVAVEDLHHWEPPILICDLCRDALHPDALPGVVSVTRFVEVDTDSGEFIEVTVGYCDKCAGLHLECPSCGAVNGVSDFLTDQWLECEGGCGTEWELRRMAHKDDLSNPDHTRVTIRLPDESNEAG